ncbi:alpha/beta hydrolase [Candidatus Viridilinea mediisalina]|nr:alpha/beta fold hydrolase [Candidatus Viridilinea mediisalina]
MLTLLLLAYVLVCTMIFFWQEQLIFFPERNSPGTRYDFGIPVEEVWIPVDGARLHALWFRVPEPRGAILYLHGNGGSLRGWGSVAPDLVAYGYDLLILDYRGYGQSSGRISSEAQLHADMAAAYAWLQERYPAEQLIIHGRSLGTALAVRLAAEQQPRLLILETPFYSLEAIARRQFPWAPPFLLKYPLRSYNWIGAVQSPVVIIHGTNDRIVPFADGERLAAKVNAPLTFVAIPGGNHNNLANFPAYWDALDQALGRTQ